MKQSQYFIFGLILIFCGALLFRIVYAAEDQAIESYSASVTRMGSAKGPTPITIRIYSYTSDEDAAKLAEMLKSRGQEAVADSIWKVKKGHIAPVGGVGMDVNFIRVLKSNKGQTIRLVTARQMSFLELKRSGLSTQYPFGILDLTVGNDGKIEGRIIAAAKVQFNKDNVVEVKSYGSDAIRLLNIKKD